MTRSAPSDVTSGALRPLVTAVTSAPSCFASWIAAVPTAPDAPLTSTEVPGPIATCVKKHCAVMPPNTSVTASSKVMVSRAPVIGPSAGTHTYSA